MLKTSLAQLAKLLPLSPDMVSNVGIGSSDRSNKMIERSLLSIISIIRAKSYLISDAKLASTKL